MSERPPEAPPGEQAPPGHCASSTAPTRRSSRRPAAGRARARPRDVRRLTRRTDNKMVAGVASGIADYLGIEPWIVRIGFVVLVPFGGFGVLAYLIAWLLVPVEGSGQSLAGDVLHRPPSGWRELHRGGPDPAGRGHPGQRLLRARGDLGDRADRLRDLPVPPGRPRATRPPATRRRRRPAPPGDHRPASRRLRARRRRPTTTEPLGPPPDPGPGHGQPCRRTCPSGRRRHPRPTARRPGAPRPPSGRAGGRSWARSPSRSP